MLNKAYYLLECIKEFNVKKIIVFLKSISESHEFSKILSVLNVFFDKRLLVNEINCNTSKTERQKILSRFKNKNETINILCNVHILDEGIDIPECDSVYLTHPNYNPINFIQRISRCNRIKPIESGIENIANVFIWAKDESKLLVVDKLIGDYLIPNIVATNNIYIRNTKNIVNSIENINNLQINKQHQSVINESLIIYIKNNSNIPIEFINDFFILYNNCEYETFLIDLDTIVKWLCSQKKIIKTTLKTTYNENIDYKVKILPPIGRGRRTEKNYLTPKCCKQLFMTSKSANASNIRNNLIAIESIINNYRCTIINTLNNKIICHENNIQTPAFV